MSDLSPPARSAGDGGVAEIVALEVAALKADAQALRSVFAKIAEGTVWERRRVDASLPLALGGALAMIGAFFTGFAAGKFP